MKSTKPIRNEIPTAFLNRMAVLLGDEYPAFLSSLQLAAITGLRINTLKLSASEFLKRSAWELSPVPWCLSGFTLNLNTRHWEKNQPGKHPYHAAGLYYLQEPSAMAAAEILAPLPGERVLDLAAAPGGKATHLAALMNDTGVLVNNEIHPKRVWDLAENLERCGVTNAVVTNETPGRLADQFGEYFNRVMLDAPCSGEGMFRKGEVARQEWSPQHVSACAVRQKRILDQAAQLVAAGGRLAYTTCTFSAEENEGVIANFLGHHPEFDLASIHFVPGFRPARPEWVGLPADDRLRRAVRIWPHQAAGEGHFIALLVKRGQVDQPVQLNNDPISGRRRKSMPIDNDYTPLDAFLTENLNRQFDHSRLVTAGSYVYLRPELMPDLSGLRVIHPGWCLGSIRKGHFTPSHALAMGITRPEACQSLSLAPGDTKLAAYLAGETITDTGEDGWILITVDGYPIGWGKRVHNVLKNYYPHGLRKRA